MNKKTAILMFCCLWRTITIFVLQSEESEESSGTFGPRGEAEGYPMRSTLDPDEVHDGRDEKSIKTDV